MKDTNVLFLLTVKEELSYLTEDTDVKQAVEKMRANGFMALPVLSRQGEYLGTISEGDLLYAIVDEEMDEEYMCDTLIIDLIRKDYTPAVKVDASMDDIINMITAQNFVPVVDDRNILMGIVTRRRVIQELCKNK